MRSSRIAIIVIVLLLLIAGSAYALFLSQTTSLALPITSGPGTEPSTQCPSNQYAYNESSSGSFICSQVGYNQLNNFPSGCPSNEFVTSITTTLNCAKAVNMAYVVHTGYCGISSTSGQMTGFNMTFISNSTRAIFAISYTLITPAASGANVGIYLVLGNSASAPTCGSAPSGYFALSGVESYQTMSSLSGQTVLTFNWYHNGLTIGDSYFLDFVVYPASVQTWTIQNPFGTIIQ